MTASRHSPRVIYIVGLGHSGSTLLDLLLSGHSRILVFLLRRTTGER
jgi:hypothetical protein